MRLARAYDEALAGDDRGAEPEADRQRGPQVLDLQAGAVRTRSSAWRCHRRQRLRRGVRDAAALPREPAQLDLGGLRQRPVPRRAAGDDQEPGLARGLLRRGRGRRRRRAPPRRLRRTPARGAARRRSRRSSPAPAAWSSGWRSRSRPRCWSATATRPSPTPSAPPASSGDWGHAFGTLPAGTDFERIIDAPLPHVAADPGQTPSSRRRASSSLATRSITRTGSRVQAHPGDPDHLDTDELQLLLTDGDPPRRRHESRGSRRHPSSTAKRSGPVDIELVAGDVVVGHRCGQPRCRDQLQKPLLEPERVKAGSGR